MKKTAFIYLATLLFFAACQKEEDVFIVEDKTVSSLQIGTVGGLLTDIDGTVLTNASVNLKTNDAFYQTKTDNNGVFYFRNIDLKEERTYLQAESDAHFSGSRVFIPKKGNAEFIPIRLMPLTVSNTFEGLAGGMFDLGQGTQLFILPEAIVDANGETYLGPVHIVNQFLKSNHPDINLMMPGDLSGLDEDGSWKSLATYGMMAVELTNDAGEKLKIANPDLASLRIPIAEEQLDNAPSSINLWSFDFQNGYWTANGTALREDDYYKTPLTDQSFLNWAIPHPIISLNTEIKLSSNNAAYTNALVEVTVVGSGICALGLTDDAGVLETTVAADQVLSIKVFGHCGEMVYQGEIGPYGTDAALTPIIIESGNTTIVELKGTLMGCNEDLITKGYTTVRVGDKNFVLFSETDGTFVSYIDACSNTALSITPVDVNGGTQGDVLNFQITELIDAGMISTCE